MADSAFVNKLKGIYAKIREITLAYQGISTEDIASQVLDAVCHDQEIMRGLAWDCIKEYADGVRRADTRQEETKSGASAPKQSDEDEDEPEPTFEEMQANPGGWVGKPPTRKAFRKWMGKGFDDWYSEGRERCRRGDTGRRVEDFEADWHPDGVKAYRRDVHISDIQRLVDFKARSFVLEPTEELFKKEVAVGDGTPHTTWGAITLEQLEKRNKMLITQTGAFIEDLVFGTAVANLLRRTGASNWPEAVKLERVQAGGGIAAD